MSHSILLDNTRFTLKLDNELTNAAANILYSIRGCEVLQVCYEPSNVGPIIDETPREFFGLIDFRIISNNLSLERILEILNQELLTSFE